MSFIDNIYRRLHKQNRNFIAICTGETGSGKSYAMLSLCNKLDENFTIDNVVFSYGEFIELVRKQELEKGAFILWDEAGAGISSREALTKSNRETTKVVQTFRSLNYGFVLTVPTMGMVDKQIRQLAHYILKTRKIDRYYKKNIISVRRIQTNEESGSTYIKRPIQYDKNGKHRLSTIITCIPPKELRDAYESKKKHFQKGMYKNRLQRRRMSQEEKYNKVLKEVREKKEEYMIKRGNKDLISWETIKSRIPEATWSISKAVKRTLERELNVTGNPEA